MLREWKFKMAMRKREQKAPLREERGKERERASTLKHVLCYERSYTENITAQNKAERQMRRQRESERESGKGGEQKKTMLCYKMWYGMETYDSCHVTASSSCSSTMKVGLGCGIVRLKEGKRKKRELLSMPSDVHGMPVMWRKKWCGINGYKGL